MFSDFKSSKLNFCPIALLFLSILFTIAACKKEENTQAQPQLTELSTTNVSPGDTLTLTGSHFSVDKTRHAVKIGDKTAEIISISPTQLKVIVPKDAVSGKVSLTSDGVTTFSTQPLLLYSIYVAGYEYKAGTSVGIAKCWGCGTTSLTDGTLNANATALTAVYNGKYNDIYVAGWQQHVGYNDQDARYWKNGVQGFIQGQYPRLASAIAVSGTDVYVAGFEGGYPCYWKNGTFVNLPTASGYLCEVTAIQVYNGDIYVAGSEADLSTSFIRHVAEYWKNGIRIPISGIKYEYAKSIFVSGTDIYLAGYEDNYYTNKGKKVAKYWKNGTAVVLSNPLYESEGLSIFVIGSDVYVAGYEYSNAGKAVAKYWKNGTPVNLTNGTNQAVATSIQVIGTDVFVAGYEYNSAGIQVAKYWKNGTTVNLTDGTKHAAANSIAVLLDKASF